MFSEAERPNIRQIYFLRLHKLPKPNQTQRKRIRKLYILEGADNIQWREKRDLLQLGRLFGIPAFGDRPLRQRVQHRDIFSQNEIRLASTLDLNLHGYFDTVSETRTVSTSFADWTELVPSVHGRNRVICVFCAFCIQKGDFVKLS